MNLTPREKEICNFFLANPDFNNKETAACLNLSKHTIDGYFNTIKSKFGVRSKSGLLAILKTP